MDSRATTGEWRLFHLLAAWTVASVAVAVLADLVFSIPNVSSTTELAALSPASIALRIVVGLGAVAALWLWVQMLKDYFRESPPTQRTAWGIVLVAGLMAGGLLYFWFVWRPRSQPRSQRAAA